MIFLHPHSGLANRIRVIVSALAFAEEVDHSLVIYWAKDQGLNANFYDLFQRRGDLVVRGMNMKMTLLNKAGYHSRVEKILHRAFKIDFALQDQDFGQYVWSSGTDFIDQTLIPQRVKNYYIKTCHEFFFRPSFLSYLKPVHTIQLLIDAETKKFPKNITGIHIRRTDNDRAIEKSPLYLFIDLIKSEIEKEPGLHFFLATDDPEVESELLSLFSGHIHITKKEFRRDSLQGIVGAMVDLYCLAATSKIYGSFWSSFSSVASRINNIPLVIIKH